MSTEQRQIRYAVIGAGWISQSAFMPGVLQSPNSVITAIVTGDQTKAVELAKQYDAKAYHYDQFEEMLASGLVDAIYIATPNHLHWKYAVPALKKGIHVLCEKPLEISVQLCEEMVAAAKEGNAKLMTAYRLHNEPTTNEVIQKIENGELGEIVTFQGTFTIDMDADNHRNKHGYWTGPVPDMGVYPLNAVRSIFKEEPIEIVALGSNIRSDVVTSPDPVIVSLKFPSKRLASFTVCFSGSKYDTYNIVGTKGSICVDPAFMYGPSIAIEYTMIQDGKVTKHTNPPCDQFAGQVSYFSQCIIDDVPVESDGTEGLLDVRVLEAIEKAITTGEKQTLPPVEHPVGKRQVYNLPYGQAIKPMVNVLVLNKDVINQ